MTKESFIAYMDSIRIFQAESDSLNSNLSAISPGAICEVGYKFLDSYIKLLSEAVEDEDDWIEWYVHENAMGGRKLKAGYGGKEKKITTLDQLWDLIQERRRGE